MAELNVSAQATLDQHVDDATTVVNLTQPKMQALAATTSKGLFTTAYQDSSLVKKHLQLTTAFATGST